jgi:hypothetical protein
MEEPTTSTDNLKLTLAMLPVTRCKATEAVKVIASAIQAGGAALTEALTVKKTLDARVYKVFKARSETSSVPLFRWRPQAS